MREQRLSYGSPAGDVSRGVLVCVCFVPAGKTPELGLGFSVSLGDVSAGRTRPAGVAWVDGHTRDSDALRLVFDEGAKLPESPVVQPFPLLLAGLNPLADMRQVFQRNAEAGAFSSGNDCLRYAVVLVLLEPPLFAAHLPKAALCCFGADALQDGASFGVAFAVLLDCRAGVLVAFAVRGDVHDAHVNAEHSVRREQSRVIEVAHGAEIPLAAHEHQIDFAFAMLKQATLMLATDEDDLVPPIQKPKRNDVIGAETQDTVIVWLRGVFAECALFLGVQLIGISHFRDAAHGYLSGEPEAFPQLGIARLVQVVLPEYLGLKCPLREPVACLVATLKRSAQSVFLLWRWLQTKVGNEFHISSMEDLCYAVKQRTAVLRTARYPSPA